MPRKLSVGPEFGGLRGVVVDHVEDDLDAGLVQRLDHRLELGDVPVRRCRRAVTLVRREEPDRVVAPVVRQPPLGQDRLRHGLVHRHQLDRGDAEPLQVLDDRGRRQPRVAAAQLGRYAGMPQRQAADMRLVDQGLVIRRAQLLIAGPVKIRVDDDIPWHIRGAVVSVQRSQVSAAANVREQGRAGRDLAIDGLAVGVEQQLGRIAPVPAAQVVRAVHAVAVPLARADVGQVAVPDEPVDLAQRDRCLSAVGVEQAKFNQLSNLGEDREVGPRTIPNGAKRISSARPYAHQETLPGKHGPWGRAAGLGPCGPAAGLGPCGPAVRLGPRPVGDPGEVKSGGECAKRRARP